MRQGIAMAESKTKSSYPLPVLAHAPETIVVARHGVAVGPEAIVHGVCLIGNLRGCRKWTEVAASDQCRTQPHVTQSIAPKIGMQLDVGVPLLCSRQRRMKLHLRAPGLFDQPMSKRVGHARVPSPHCHAAQTFDLHSLPVADNLFCHPNRETVVAMFSRAGNRAQPDRPGLSTRQMVRDPAPEEGIVGQNRQRASQYFRRTFAQPKRHACRECHLSEWRAIDCRGDRASGIEPAARDSERKEKRREAQGEIRQPRMSIGNCPRRRLERSSKSPELTLQQFPARGTPGRSPQRDCMHETKAERPPVILEMGLGSVPGNDPGQARQKPRIDPGKRVVVDIFASK